MPVFLLFVIACAACTAQTSHPTRTSGDEAAIKDVVARYVDARDRKDAKATEALFTADADQLVSSGEWRRDATPWYAAPWPVRRPAGGSAPSPSETVRFVAPGAALADGRYEIAGIGGAPARRMWSTFLITRTPDGWRIAAIRNMLPARPRRLPRRSE